MSDVTQLLNAIGDGDRHAADQLLPLVYEELRHLAAAKMAKERPGQTLDATALVHEAYIRLLGDEFAYSSSRHFFLVAAEAMRRILIDRARQKQRVRHGGDRKQVTLSEADPVAVSPDEDFTALDEALQRFAVVEPIKAELVKLRYFAGLSEEEAAKVLDISRATASRYWTYSRAWLIAAMEKT